MTDIHFITKGQVPSNQPTYYVERDCDIQFDEYLKRKDYIALIGPRRTGKTSLLIRKHHALRSLQRYVPIYVNLALMNALAGSAWYQRLHSAIIEGSNGQIPATSLAADELALRDKLLYILDGNLRGHVLVIMLDDVAMIPQSIRTPLMAMLREIFSSRETIEAFKRCVIVLSGSFLPDDLINDPTISPFRIAERVNTNDATVKGIAQLVALLDKPNRRVAPGVIERIFHWTDGDLYLTQRLCAMIQQNGAPITPALVDNLATHQLTEDDIFHRVVRYLEQVPRSLDLIREIQTAQRPMRFSRLQRIMEETWLMGIIKENSEGNCAVRNSVYEAVLHRLDPGSLRPPLPPFPVPAETPDIDPILIPGRLILQNRYRIEDLLGEGAMAQVFRAFDFVDRKVVAVKRLRVQMSENPLILERFHREGESLRELQHPNIVQFIDIFVEDDFHYIVMEHIPGGSLGQLLHRYGRSLPISSIINIIVGLSDALDHAHNRGIIHRDLKPSNVLLTPDFTPRLADFGIARLLGRSPLTDLGTMLGTFSYMSPEMCQAQQVQAAADLWSLGVILFEMLVGTVPFEGSAPATITHAILHAPIPNVRHSRPEVPMELVNIVNHLLMRDIDKRYPSAHALSRDLRSLFARP